MKTITVPVYHVRTKQKKTAMVVRDDALGRPDRSAFL